MTTRLYSYRAAIASSILAAMPALKACEALSARFDLGELTARAIRAPAVFVVLLRTPLKRAANGSLDADANVAIFCVTQGPEERREADAFAMAEAIAVLATVRQLWGLTRVGPCEALDIEQVQSSALDKKGVSCVAVTFRQRVSGVGDGLFADEEKLPTELYVNGELTDQAIPPEVSHAP